MNREIFELSIHGIDPKKIEKYKDFIESFYIVDEKEEENDMANSFSSVLSILKRG